jgi:hypothetical protein
MNQSLFDFFMSLLHEHHLPVSASHDSYAKVAEQFAAFVLRREMEAEKDAWGADHWGHS